jgi:hypothetical protein
MEKKLDSAALLVIVEDAITAMKNKFTGDTARGTIGDLIRLLQLRQELSVERQGKIMAGWVSECDQTLIDL